MANLVESLTAEIVRVEKIKDAYLELPNGAGSIGAFVMQEAIKYAQKAQACGEIIEMIKALRCLQDFEL